MTESSSEIVGIATSPTKIDEFNFVLLPKRRITKGDYCLIEHPLEKTSCLARVIGGLSKNPELLPTAVTALLSKLGYQVGKEQEIVLLKAELLGYRSKDRSLRLPDFPPSPGSVVRKASQLSIEPLLAKKEGILIEAGIDPFSNLTLKLSLDDITKGHVAICGMTRSGKTTFVINFISGAIKEGAKFLIFDRAGEYATPLIEAGILPYVIDPHDLRGLSALTEDSIRSMLGLDKGRKSGIALPKAIKSIIDRGEIELLKSREAIVDECAFFISARGKTLGRIQDEIALILDRSKEILNKLISMKLEPINVIKVLKQYDVVIIDLSKEKSIFDQQLTVTHTLERIFDYAIATRGEDITFLVVIEETQFYAPERTVITYGDPFGTKSLPILTACLSQLGGYNVGFIIMSQRPAYVSKALLSQCNTFITFRMRAGADHDQISAVTGYPKWRISALLSGLRDHVGYLIGMASPFEFPTFIETPKEGRIYPRKATLTPSQVINKNKA